MSNIIELSYINSKTSNSTADWINTFQPITLGAYDSLSFKVGFLDYGNENQFGTIEIGEDVNITMECGFYLNTSGYEIDKNIQTDPNANAKNFNLYVARYDSTYQLIKSNVNFIIEKGVYTPAELTTLINKQLTTLPTQSIGSDIDLLNNPNKYFFRSNQLGEGVLEFYECINVANDTYKLYLRDRYSSQLAAFNINDICKCYIEFDPNTNSFECVVQNKVIAERDQSYIEIVSTQESPNENFKNGYLIKNKINEHTGIKKIYFYDPTKFNSEQYVTIANPGWIGASQIDLEFNKNNNGRFSWEYLHTSCHDPHAGDSPCITIYGIDGTFFQYQNVYSGIFFTQLEPASFWEGILGFDLEKIVFTDNNVTHNLNKFFQFGDNITGDLISYDDIYDKSKTAEAITGPLNVDINQTFNLLANKLQNIQISQYFIIQLIGLGNPNYSMDDKTFQTIAHIGSKEYDNNGNITLFGDGSNFYTNTGMPKILNNLNVRILDGNTKEPTQILGRNNSIFIQINRINPNNIKDF